MLKKGSLHIIPPASKALTQSRGQQSITFQYNPNLVKRELKPNLVGGQSGGHSGSIRYGTAPDEVFSLQVEIDALDNLPSKSQNKAAVIDGIYPLLSALELLLYPRLSVVKSNQTSLDNGVLQVAPFIAPQVLLNWGQKRIVPVVMESYSVEEQMFDQALNPIRATIQISLRAITYDDVRPGNANYESFVSYQRFKENEAGKI
ncbi:hypothetical protein [Sneathiella sp.]|jgi:hypothetical protein|uniref:hypothetical protein n=1 Tax=Sneathiella sp. TaxID=1964365 RepID=UPI0039E331B7